jgi:hypothetical protein
LWHSLFVDSTTWNLLVAPLASERPLVIIDGPDHGGSPPWSGTRSRLAATPAPPPKSSIISASGSR